MPETTADAGGRPTPRRPSHELSVSTAETPGMARRGNLGNRMRFGGYLDGERPGLHAAPAQPTTITGIQRPGSTSSRAIPCSWSLTGTASGVSRLRRATTSTRPPFVAPGGEPLEEEAVVVIARTTQEAIAVNLDSLHDLR